MQTKKILVAEDHPLMRQQLHNLVKSEWPDLNIILATNGKETLEAYKRHNPDLLLLDYQMPYFSGFEAAEQILNQNKFAKIIILTMFDSAPILLNFLKIGGKGFLSKTCNSEELIKCIKQVSNGNYHFHTKHDELISIFLKNGLNQKLPQIQFTEREILLVIELSKGKSNNEIAAKMNLSTRTIESYRSELMKKAGVSNSMELLFYFFSNGIIQSVYNKL